MNKKSLIISLPLLTLLVGCNEPVSSSSPISSEPISSKSNQETQLEETLEKLKEGYKLEVLYNQHVKVASGNESESDFFKLLDISASKDIYRSTSYKEVTDVSLINKESFVSDISYSNKNGKLVESRLTVENVIEDRQVVDSSSSPITWADSNLDNFFGVFDFASLEKNEEGNYIYKGKINALQRHKIAAQLLGIDESGRAINEISFSFEGENLYLNVKFDTYRTNILGGMAAVDVTDNIKAKIIKAGEIAIPVSKIAKEEDKAFVDAFKKLQNLNFKTTAKNYEIKYKDGRYELASSASCLVSSSSIQTTIKDENDKIVSDDVYFKTEHGMQKAVKFGEEYYASLTPVDRTISSYFPTYKISSVFFNKEGNKYTLDNAYTGLISSTYLFSPFVNDDIKNLEITISDSRIDIVSTSDGNGTTVFGEKEEFSYEEIGTQTDFDSSGVKYDSSTLSWKKVIRDSSTYKRLLSQTINEETLNKIPFFGGVYVEAKYVESGFSYPYLSVTVNSQTQAQELETRYDAALPLAGFKLNKETDAYEISVGNETLQVVPVAQAMQDLSGNTSYVFALILNKISK
ncbi:MAG: hypothetical protein SO132_02240 [Candidatus Enteromonas sp.]|nr:hypothetical protein [Candidatus Enteromonas sp.]